MEETIQQKLVELQKTRSEFWNISPEVANFLNLLIKSGNYKNILELGTSNGYSAIWLALALQETGGHLVSIEYSEERKELARKNLEECNLLDKVTLIQGKIIEILERLDLKLFYLHEDNDIPYIDFAFVDASKLEYAEYFNLIHPMLKKNGMIVADNVVSHESKLWNYIDMMTAHEDYQTVKLDIGAGLLVSLKINK
ncbi:MAG: class I SAM-dependent methyltransferase [bacterium]